jgi:hypothetical protein
MILSVLNLSPWTKKLLLTTGRALFTVSSTTIRQHARGSLSTSSEILTRAVALVCREPTPTNYQSSHTCV